MDYNQAKNALYEICRPGGSGDEKEVKKILDEHPNLINEVIISIIINILIIITTYHILLYYII